MVRAVTTSACRPVASKDVSPVISELPDTGFQFDNFLRNARLEKLGLKAPRAKKTGTTIVGIVFKDGVILGADTRATNESIVCDKNCEKIHYIAPNIYCCGAGTSADTENTTAMVSSQLKLHSMATGRQALVVTALTMLKQYLFQYQGHVSAALILGGVDRTGPSLYTVYPHGSTDRLPFVTMGSGSLAAMAIFEAEWAPQLELDAGVALVQRAVLAGIFNDLGSGGNVDVTILTKDRVDIRRNVLTPNERLFRNPRGYVFPHGTTVVLPPKTAQTASANDDGDAMRE